MSEPTITVITDAGLFEVRWPFAAAKPPRTPVYWDAEGSVLTLDDRGGTLSLLGFIHETHLPVAPPDPAPDVTAEARHE
jgi:hypothetical protein